MPEPDDHDLTGLPNFTTAGDGSRATHASLPLKELADQAEAMADIGVPGHLLDADPPDELLDLDALRALLYNETVPLARRDAAWRYLVTNAVQQRGRWYVYVLGVVALRLIEQAHWLTPGGQHGTFDDKRQVHQHLSVGFLAELFNVRPDDERIGDRIVWRAVYRAKRAWWNNKEPAWPPVPGEPETEPEPAAGPDHELPPDDELAWALRALVAATADVNPSRADRRPKITAQDAALLALCTLYGRTITEAAEELDMGIDAARAKLPRIKRAVFTSLASPYLRRKRPQWAHV